MEPRPFLNIDAGELEDEPAELCALAHVVNCAAGGHAGDQDSMARVAGACRAHGTKLGVHPSYPDRAGFGRRSIPMSAGAVERSVRAQIAALVEAARESGIGVLYAKPHGALYHDADAVPALADAVVRPVSELLGVGVTLIGPPARNGSGELSRAARRFGITFAAEGFADRAARSDGSLVPRSQPGAVLDPGGARARAAELIAAGTLDTICVHGDSPGAVEVARAVRALLL